jgi:hypothetical protein
VSSAGSRSRDGEVLEPVGRRNVRANPASHRSDRDEFGAERADALVARIEAMTYDEMVEHLGAELDRALASAR